LTACRRKIQRCGSSQCVARLAFDHPLLQAYWEYIKQQEQAAETERGYIHPVPDCVIRTSVQLATGAPLPPLPNAPDTSPLRQAPAGAKLLINVCSCDRVAPPTLPDGRSVLGHPPNSPYRPPRPSDTPLAPPSDAEIAHHELFLTLHTAVGDARGVCKAGSTAPGSASASDAVVVDIVFHPWVAQRRAASKQLHEAMLDFVLGTVEDACAVRLERPGKYVAATYRGWAHAPAPSPDAPPLITPWPFWLDAKARTQAEKDVKGGYRPPLCLWSKPKPAVDELGSSTLTTGDVLKAVKGGSASTDEPPAISLSPVMGTSGAASATAPRQCPAIQVLDGAEAQPGPGPGPGPGAGAVDAQVLPSWCRVSTSTASGHSVACIKVLLDLHNLPPQLHDGNLEVGCDAQQVMLRAPGVEAFIALPYIALASAAGVACAPQQCPVHPGGLTVKRSDVKGLMVIKLPLTAAGREAQ